MNEVMDLSTRPGRRLGRNAPRAAGAVKGFCVPWKRMGRGRWVAATVLVVLVFGGLGWLVTPARADLTQFEARAAADGVRVGVLAPGASLFDQIADTGAPVAQSELTGLGTSQAFASLPYPGDTVVSGPGTVATLLGAPQPPPYPAIVQSSHPSAPDTTTSQPGYELKAHSDGSSSVASATAGGSTGDSGAGSTRATASSKLDGDTLVAEATSTTELFTASGVLRIGQAFARARAARDGAGQLTRDSDFHVDGLAVADVSLGLGPGGLVLAGSKAPLPDDSALAQVLQQAGVSVKYLAPVEDETGLVSAGAQITQKQEFQGTTYTVTYTLGRASAHAGAAAAEPGAPAQSPAEPPAPAPAGPTAVEDVGTGVAPANDVSQVGGSTLATPASPSARTTGRAPVTERTTLTRAASLGSRSSIYLVLVLAAVAGVVATQLFRALGVKLAWRF